MPVAPFLIAAALALGGLGACAKPLPVEQIKLPPGFHIEVWARVDNARAMTLGANRTLFVGSRGSGRVVAVTFDEAMRAGRQYVVATGLNMPVGVAFRDGALYVSAVDRILRFDAIESRLDHPPRPVVVTDKLPKETHHGWKFIAFGPDGRLYVPVGAPCNICEPDPDRYANILRMEPDGSRWEVFARGVRNTVGFDWHPQTGELWFTDNGRDWMGDDSPPCELNHAPRAGGHFGYPYCHGGTIADPEFGRKHSCSEFAAPALNLGPHVAPLGMRFYTGAMFPAAWRGRIFIAEHGSWNRSKKIGYRVLAARLEGNKVVSAEPFAEGWLQGESDWGRPADVQVLPDGSLLVSDDAAGAIYRITYGTTVQ
jgi:glucose/arabinose dehydrogenase